MEEKSEPDYAGPEHLVRLAARTMARKVIGMGRRRCLTWWLCRHGKPVRRI